MSRIFDAKKDPLGRMLKDYQLGDTDAFLTVWSETMDMSAMRGSLMFRGTAEMEDIEIQALAACKGRVLDVGAGSGCHTLVLQERGFDVDAIDISPGCVEIMRDRGVNSVHHLDVHEMAAGSYDTILMLMNGVGICGTLDGLNLYFQHVENLLAPGGQILLDSTDLTPSCNEIDIEGMGYCGETEFVMIYKGMRSDPFSWLYIDFELLLVMSSVNGFDCELLFDDGQNRFLARLSKPV